MTKKRKDDKKEKALNSEQTVQLSDTTEA